MIWEIAKSRKSRVLCMIQKVILFNTQKHLFRFFMMLWGALKTSKNCFSRSNAKQVHKAPISIKTYLASKRHILRRIIQETLKVKYNSKIYMGSPKASSKFWNFVNTLMSFKRSSWVMPSGISYSNSRNYISIGKISHRKESIRKSTCLRRNGT